MACTYYDNIFGDQSSPELYGFDESETPGKPSELVKNFMTSPSSSSSSLYSTPSSTNSNGYANYRAPNYHPQECHNSLINFKSGPGYNHFMHNTGSFLSFEQNNNDQVKQISQARWFEDFNSGDQSTRNTMNENQIGGKLIGWPSFDANLTNQEDRTQEQCSNKRLHMGESIQAQKKQCTSAKGPKPKSTQSKEPQSMAAKNRRERISERLKILQELVPNGCKVDLVTMLEKATSYVKFLQLQVKVLATDEFWPEQGGKAPDIAQVKEAIDAILSSQNDTNKKKIN